MIPSRQYRSWLLHVFLILLLHSPGRGIGSRTITIANECSEPIWPVVADKSNTEKAEEYGVPIGSSITFEKQSGWNGRVWAKTGSLFNNSDTRASVTLIEFALRTTESSPDFYDVNLVNGYNLPVVVTPINGSGPGCAAAGCVDDLNKSCPAELRTAGGAACQGPCEVYKTAEYCCTSTKQACGPTDYSRLFKRVCPRAYSYPRDDANSTFYCNGAAAQYLITFCAPSFDSLLVMPPAGSPDSFSTSPMPYVIGHAPQIKPVMPPAGSPDTFSTNPMPYVIGYAPQIKPVMPPAGSPDTFSTNPIPPQRMPPAYPPNSFSTNPPQTKRGKIHAKEIIPIVSVSLSGVIIVSIAMCIFLKRRRRHSLNGPKRKCKRDVENLLLQHGSLAPKRYRYLEIKKMTKSLSEKLGQGGFGSVYKGMLPDGRHVAVKILSEIMDSNGEEFINEVASISRTSHVNIVSLLGFCYEGNKSALVYEYMPNKSLDKFLGHDGDGSMDLKKLYEIAVGIAKGLEYLHTGCTTRIVHFDIKPQNILLDDELCPKISDFGLAKLCKKKQSVLSMLGTRGTAGYIAPEVFSRNFGAVSHKSDVYSYGMMLLEMAGAKKNVGIEEIQSTSENYFPDKIYEKVITDITNTSNRDDESMMIEEEEEGRRKMMLIGFWCIQTIPSERPSMSKVVEMLEGSIESIQIPPKPFLFSTVIPHQQTSFSSSSSSFSTIVETDNLAPN